MGVVQEQHADRAWLYRQWRKLEWPIYVDALNTLDLAVVPIVVAIDESGIVRHDRITPERLAVDFVSVEYPAAAIPPSYSRVVEPDLKRLGDIARSSESAKAWRDFGDACSLVGQMYCSARMSKANDTCDLVQAYEKAIALDSNDGRAHFRLGVALRARYESAARKAGGRTGCGRSLGHGTRDQPEPIHLAPAIAAIRASPGQALQLLLLGARGAKCHSSAR